MTPAHPLLHWLLVGSFPALIGLALIYLLRLDRDATTRFRLVQFVANPDGTANSASLAYVVVLLVTTWAIWVLVVQGALTEGYLGLYAGTFVAGGVARAAVARPRPGAAPAEPAPPP